MWRVSLVTDVGGACVAEARFLPYGELRYTSGNSSTDFGFAGQRDMPSIELIYMHVRYYDPALTRFIQSGTLVPQPANL